MSNEQVSFDDEMLIVVDQDDNIIDYKDKITCHLGEAILHRAFSIFIFNDEGQLLLQQRSDQKMLWPLIWSNSCCSHPRKGETLEVATHRRLREELGIDTELQHLFTFQYSAKWKDVGSEREMCAVYIGKSNKSPTVNANEIAAWKYIDMDELEREIAANSEMYSPWMRMELERMKRDHQAAITALINS